jgi:thiol:disulfide interchange protein DsbA
VIKIFLTLLIALVIMGANGPQLIKVIGDQFKSQLSPEPAAGEYIAPLHAQVAHSKYFSELPNPIKKWDGKIVEIFWLGCPHCQALEPLLQNWKKDSDREITYVPATANASWKGDARLVMAIEKITGNYEGYHAELLKYKKETHFKTQSIQDIERIVNETSLKDHPGTSPEILLVTMNSTEVDVALEWVKNFLISNRVRGVPTVVINGTHILRSDLKGSFENTFIPALNYAKNNMM